MAEINMAVSWSDTATNHHKHSGCKKNLKCPQSHVWGPEVPPGISKGQNKEKDKNRIG